MPYYYGILVWALLLAWLTPQLQHKATTMANQQQTKATTAPATTPSTPTAAPLAVPAVAALANNNTTHNTTPGALCSTFGVVLRSPGGSVTTCRSKGAQWPNLGGTPAVTVHPCQGGQGGTLGGAALATGHNNGAKLWAYQPGAVRVALCPAGMAALAKLAQTKGTPASLVALAALCVAVG